MKRIGMIVSIVLIVAAEADGERDENRKPETFHGRL